MSCLATVGQGGVGGGMAACGDGYGAGRSDDDTDDDAHCVSAVGILTLSSCTSGNACDRLQMAVLSMATCGLQAQPTPVDVVL
jgi:hypothetical protein